MQLTVTMKDLDVIRKAHRISGVGSVDGPYDRGNPNWAPMWRWSVRRKEDVLFVLKGMFDNLGERRKGQIAKVLKNAGMSLADIDATDGPHEFRWDAMYEMATEVFLSLDEYLDHMRSILKK